MPPFFHIFPLPALQPCRYVIKAQLLKAQPVEREMRAFDVVVSQSMGKLSESSFEFLYSIREADNRAADHAGRLLATALAVCVPVRKPGERMPLSEGFKELVAQSRAAERRRDSETDMAGEAYVPDEQYPVGNGDSDDTRVNVQGADRLALQQMLTMQLSSFHSPEIANNSALEVHGHIMSMPVLLRPSDEDWNCHVNNTSFIRFFDDALCIMRETMPAVRALASVAPSKAAFDYLRECSLACTGCHVLCKFYDGSEAEGVDDGMHAWNPDGLASLAMLFRGFDASGKDQIFARARYAFPKV